MNKKNVAAVVFACFAAAPAMADELPNGITSFGDEARVISAKPVYSEPRRVTSTTCEDVVPGAQSQSERGMTGSVIGGVAGGLLGSNVGKGSGKTAATAVGAIIGAITGDRVQNNGNGNGNASAGGGQNCVTTERMSERGRRVVGWDVKADYHGQVINISYDSTQKPGAYVPVNVYVAGAGG